MRCCFLTILQS